MTNLTNSIIAQILDMTQQGVGKWKKQNRPIIKLLEKYFTKDELIEFIETKKIEKYEKFKNINYLQNKILDNFFFEHYSRKPTNRDLADDIFPKFEDYVEKKLKKRRDFLEENKIEKTISDIKYINKEEFFEFLLNLEIDNENKVDVLKTVSELKEIDFFLIMNNYNKYLSQK